MLHPSRLRLPCHARIICVIFTFDDIYIPFPLHGSDCIVLDFAASNAAALEQYIYNILRAKGRLAPQSRSIHYGDALKLGSRLGDGLSVGAGGTSEGGISGGGGEISGVGDGEGNGPAGGGDAEGDGLALGLKLRLGDGLSIAGKVLGVIEVAVHFPDVDCNAPCTTCTQ